MPSRRPHEAPLPGARRAAPLERLRGGGDRPFVDPGLAGGLRDWLEVGLSEEVALLPDDDPVRVTKERLNQVLICEAHLAASADAPRVMTPELARGSLVDAVFRQWVTVGCLEDPLLDALAALDAEGDHAGVLEFVAGLPTDGRRRLAAEVADHAASIRAGWAVPHRAWLARTQERIEVPLVGGRVVLAGVIDLLLGGPAAERSSVCVVEVKSGARRVEHRSDLLFYALLETLRSGAPPFRVATYYTHSGELDDETVSENLLADVLDRVLTGTVRLCRLASGSAPVPSPNPLCAWCVGLPRCSAGQRRAGSAVPRTGRAGELDELHSSWSPDPARAAAGEPEAAWSGAPGAEVAS